MLLASFPLKRSPETLVRRLDQATILAMHDFTKGSQSILSEIYTNRFYGSSLQVGWDFEITTQPSFYKFVEQYPCPDGHFFIERIAHRTAEGKFIPFKMRFRYPSRYPNPYEDVAVINRVSADHAGAIYEETGADAIGIGHIDRVAMGHPIPAVTGFLMKIADYVDSIDVSDAINAIFERACEDNLWDARFTYDTYTESTIARVIQQCFDGVLANGIREWDDSDIVRFMTIYGVEMPHPKDPLTRRMQDFTGGASSNSRSIIFTGRDLAHDANYTRNFFLSPPVHLEIEESAQKLITPGRYAHAAEGFNNLEATDCHVIYHDINRLPMDKRRYTVHHVFNRFNPTASVKEYIAMEASLYTAVWKLISDDLPEDAILHGVIDVEVKKTFAEEVLVSYYEPNAPRPFRCIYFDLALMSLFSTGIAASGGVHDVWLPNL